MNTEHQIIFYSGPDGETRVEVFFLEESLWLSQKRMAELFDVEVNTISYHLKEIFKSGELEEKAVIRNFRITAIDGKNYPTNLYHLDGVIAVGYRVNPLYWFPSSCLGTFAFQAHVCLNAGSWSFKTAFPSWSLGTSKRLDGQMPKAA